MKKQNKTRKPEPKQTLSPVALLERERRQLDRYLFKFSRSAPTSAFKLPQQQFTQAGVMNDWSIKDVLAWLVSWERGLMAWLRAPSRRPPAASETDGNDLLDPETFRNLRRRSLDDVVEAYQDSSKTVMRALRDNSGVVSDIVALNLASRYGKARSQIRSWLKKQAVKPVETTARAPAPAPPRSRSKKHQPRRKAR